MQSILCKLIRESRELLGQNVTLTSGRTVCHGLPTKRRGRTRRLKRKTIEDEGRTIDRARRNVCYSRQLDMFQVFDINKDILVFIERQNTDVYK